VERNIQALNGDGWLTVYILAPVVADSWAESPIGFASRRVIGSPLPMNRVEGEQLLANNLAN
jgi:hypothetical protein